MTLKLYEAKREKNGKRSEEVQEKNYFLHRPRTFGLTKHERSFCEGEEINWKKCACWLKNWRQILIKFILFLSARLEAASSLLTVFKVLGHFCCFHFVIEKFHSNEKEGLRRFQEFVLSSHIWEKRVIDQLNLVELPEIGACTRNKMFHNWITRVIGVFLNHLS